MRYLLIFLVLFSTPASPQLKHPVPVRYEYVYSIAMATCYRMQGVLDARVQPIMNLIQDRFRLSNDEVKLYLNYCLLYDQGYYRKVPR